jgi:predicted metal-binding membrane protein
MWLARKPNGPVAVVLALSGIAWAALLLGERTPYGRYLDHGRWTEIGLADSICRMLPGGELLLPGLAYAAGWVLMTAAMMLPTVLALLQRFDRMTVARGDRSQLLALLLCGYLLTWLAFGAVAHIVDGAVHSLARQSQWLLLNAWTLGAGLLMTAGLFQFSRLKYHCLDKCRSPVGFIVRHWHGVSPRREALLLGAHHGLFCVGCCWALMLLMFVIGTGNVGWMLMLGLAMAIEKNTSWGRKLSSPLGAGLIAGALVVAIGHLG